MNKPVIPWSPFGRRPLPRRFPVPKIAPKKRRKIIPWSAEEWHVVRGDTVEIMVGKDKGKQGKIREVARRKNWVFVQNLNLAHKYMRPFKDFQGGYFPIEVPLHAADVKLVDPSTGKGTEIVWRYTEQGKRVRVSLDSNKIIPKPPFERADFKSKEAVPDGEFDTKAQDASQYTYVPSLLLFHEEIMKTYNVPPTIPKVERDSRDVIMDQIKQDAEKQTFALEMKEQPPFYMTALVFVRNLAESLKFWK